MPTQEDSNRVFRLVGYSLFGLAAVPLSCGVLAAFLLPDPTKGPPNDVVVGLNHVFILLLLLPCSLIIEFCPIGQIDGIPNSHIWLPTILNMILWATLAVIWLRVINRKSDADSERHGDFSTE